MTIGGATILVETPHQLLVNKLCALLSRSEIEALEQFRQGLVERVMAAARPGESS